MADVDRNAILDMLEQSNEDWKQSGGANFTPEDGEYLCKITQVKPIPKTDKAGKNYVMILANLKIEEGVYEGKEFPIFIHTNRKWDLINMKKMIGIISEEEPAETLSTALLQLEERCVGIPFMLKYYTSDPVNGRTYKNWMPVNEA